MFIFKRSPIWCFEDDPNNPGGGGGKPPVVVKVGDQEFDAAKVEELVNTVNSVKPVAELAKRYNLSPEEYGQYSENALAIVSELQSHGMLGDDGKLKLPKADPPKVDPPANPPANPPKGGQDEIVSLIEKLNERLDRVETGTSHLFKGQITAKLTSKFPDFTEDDVTYCGREAKRTGRPILEIAEARNESNTAARKQIEDRVTKDIAEKFNLDFDELNKVKELSSDGGVTPAKVLGDKKISFRQKKGENSVQPRHALLEFLNTRDKVS